MRTLAAQAPPALSLSCPAREPTPWALLHNHHDTTSCCGAIPAVPSLDQLSFHGVAPMPGVARPALRSRRVHFQRGCPGVAAPSPRVFLKPLHLVLCCIIALPCAAGGSAGGTRGGAGGGAGSPHAGGGGDAAAHGAGAAAGQVRAEAVGHTMCFVGPPAACRYTTWRSSSSSGPRKS